VQRIVITRLAFGSSQPMFDYGLNSFKFAISFRIWGRVFLDLNPLRDLRIDNVVWIVVHNQAIHDFRIGNVSQIFYGSVPLNQFRLQYPAGCVFFVDHGFNNGNGYFVADRGVNANAIKAFSAEV